jgi:hypothetical protein
VLAEAAVERAGVAQDPVELALAAVAVAPGKTLSGPHSL